jgi:cystathionine gamma-synthase
LDRLEAQLKAQQSTSERILAVFCEFPGNPLLDLQRLRALADTYDFAVIVDETIGCFANIQLLPWADAIVSSLTKVFSGDSNVMGGR